MLARCAQRTRRAARLAALLPFFCLAARGAISNFSPTNGQPGTVLTVNGSDFTGATNFLFNGAAPAYADFEILSASQMLVVVPVGATTGSLSVVVGGVTSSSEATFTVAPTITGFTPTTGAYPTSVTIFGANFVNGGTTVSFTGASPVPGDVTSEEGDQVVATVPVNAAAGPITVTTTSGFSAVSTNIFLAGSMVDVTGFSPAFATNPSSVTVYGDNFVVGGTTVKFGGLTSSSVTVVATTELQAEVPVAATNCLITVSTAGGTGRSTNTFLTGSSPFITGFSPVLGPSNTLVLIEGYNLNYPIVTGVEFGAISVKTNDLAVWNPTQIQAPVPGGASNAPITVLSSKGNYTTSSNFLSSTGPFITGFSPVGGAIATPVTITGFNFTHATNVKFGAGSVAVTAGSDSELQATVPADATTGPIEVSTGLASSTTSSNFTVTGDAPVISSFSPASGVQGMTVTIQGDFSDLPATGGVTFNGAAATYPLTSFNQVQAVVPAAATSGPIGVSNRLGGKTASSALFYLQPWITTFSPAKAVANSTLTITGRNLTNASALAVNGVPWNFTGTAAQITATVPTNATSGPMTLTAPGGVFITTNIFAVLPQISSFSPPLGPTNTLVTINGVSLFDVTNVQFNGISAAPVFVTNNQVRARVPPGATTGLISVFTQYGGAVSAGSFIVTQPSLVVLTKTPSSQLLRPGADVTYTLTVTNQGPSIVTGLTVTDPIPPFLSYVSASSTLGACSYGDGVVTNNVGVLSNNTALTLTIVEQSFTNGAFTNFASLYFLEGNLVPADNSASAIVYYLSAAQQTLNIQLLAAPSSVLLSWTNSGVPFLLQSNNDLALPSSWQTFSPAIVVVGGQNYVTNNAVGEPAFFRLTTP
ncbi:MAG: DUF11 domain-containing protein [Verrucomicrobiota bacterium]